ncbi:hypothetical protein M9Y10_041972 [Tritrichomonas musculus]|uniref:Uncharacterized protein n=1 Tax=Tritrichomonas musculus TaxID=1915356 RepID=A0ABR2K5W2_9EUKA
MHQAQSFRQLFLAGLGFGCLLLLCFFGERHARVQRQVQQRISGKRQGSHQRREERLLKASRRPPSHLGRRTALQVLPQGELFQSAKYMVPSL